jgi:sugar-specific transcriptional regulator TrmB
MGQSEHDLKLLEELGLTKNQATLYLTLLSVKKSDARKLSVSTGILRTDVYRSLSELELKGLVDRKIGLPIEFMAVTPSLGLQHVLEARINAVENTEQKTIAFIKKFQTKRETFEDNDSHEIKLINGRKRIVDKIRKQHDDAKDTIEICSILPRWLQIIDECRVNYQNALDRGVHYKVIVALPNANYMLPKNVISLLKHKNFTLKKSVITQSINSAMFDYKEATFDYYPSKPLGSSPLIVTNHPSFIDLSKGYFQMLWNSLPDFKSSKLSIAAEQSQKMKFPLR